MSLVFTQTVLSSEKFIGHKTPRKDKVLITYKPRETRDTLNQGKDRLSILVWNMYKGDRSSWERDFKTISQDKDLLITQEMYLNKKMRRVLKEYNDFEYTTATSFLYNGKIRTGVMTGSKSLSTSKNFLISKNREPIVKSPKITLLNEYLLSNGEKLLVANIHAVNFVSSRKLLRQVREVINHIKNHQGPVIFAGDFNTWTKKKTRRVRAIMRDHGLKEVKFPPNRDARMKIFGRVLDFIFYRDLKLLTSDVLGNIGGSDHKPMIATFELN